jgi:hypothetical protein
MSFAMKSIVNDFPVIGETRRFDSYLKTEAAIMRSPPPKEDRISIDQAPWPTDPREFARKGESRTECMTTSSQKMRPAKTEKTAKLQPSKPGGKP